MPHETKLAGLCSTCIHAGDCSISREDGTPVLECEEFETWQPLNAAPRKSGPAAEPKHVIPAAGKGLCGDCEHRDTCTFPRPEGGVWHCEEYR